MTFRDTLQPASFRGVPFHVGTADTAVGRRVVVHEFPMKDVPLPEDLGRRATEFVVDGFIIGDDYLDGMKKLMAALTEPGPGTLVHPTQGELQVVLVNPTRLREQFIERRGMVSFSLAFVEAGELAQPTTVDDTQQDVEVAADDCYEPIEDEFTSKFDVDGMPAWSIESIVDEISNIADVIGSVRDGLGFDFTSLSALVRAGNSLKSNLTKLLATPGALAKELTVLARGLVGLFDFSAEQSRIFGALGVSPSTSRSTRSITSDAAKAISYGSVAGMLAVANRAAANAAKSPVAGSVGGSARNASKVLPFGSVGRITRPMDALLRLASYGQPGTPTARPQIPTNTPIRRRQATNQAATFALISRAAVVEAVRSSVYIPFESVEQSIAIRDRLYDALDTVMLDAPDPVYAALHDLRSAMVRDITARGADLVRLSSITLQASAPARVLSYRLYGVGGFDIEIVVRNQSAGTLLHPLFVPGGTPLGVRRV